MCKRKLVKEQEPRTMKTIYDMGDKVIIVAVVQGMQMNGDNKCPLYTIRVPSSSGHYNNVLYLTETELDEMNGKKRASNERKGEWVDLGGVIRYGCPFCHHAQERKSNFCPHCGARMDGKEQEHE